MEDICSDNGEVVFNYRVAIIIRNKSKILVQKDDRVSHLTLPGGRCKLNESSVSAGIREFVEETALSVEYVKSIGVIENFFNSKFNGKNYHEILFIHELKLVDELKYNETILKNVEDNKKEHISYIWKSIDELKESDFKPNVVLSILNNNDFVHLINKEY